MKNKSEGLDKLQFTNYIFQKVCVQTIMVCFSNVEN